MEPVAYVVFGGVSLVGVALVVIGVVGIIVVRHRVGALADRQRELQDAMDRLTHVIAARDQAWFWTPEWQAGEREADEDFAAGRGILFKSEEDMDDFLDGIPSYAKIAKVR